MGSEIKVIKTELSDIRQLFKKVVQIIPSCNITGPKILLYGLKPHTRSVS